MIARGGLVPGMKENSIGPLSVSQEVAQESFHGNSSRGLRSERRIMLGLASQTKVRLVRSCWATALDVRRRRCALPPHSKLLSLLAAPAHLSQHTARAGVNHCLNFARMGGVL